MQTEAVVADAPKIVDVAAGLVIDAAGRLLLGQRPVGKPYEGWWELPGGKLEPGETPLQALARELNEEIGIEVTRAVRWVTHVHAYTHATVRLYFCRVTGWRGEPTGLENQQLHWVDPALDVAAIEAALGGKVLPATVPPLQWLQVPEVQVILDPAPDETLQALAARVEQALTSGVRLFQFRGTTLPANDERLHAALRAMMARSRQAGARVVVNSRHPQSWWREADGVHLRSGDLAAPLPDLGDGWIGASVHNAHELALARAVGARYAVLGPVLPTASHPGAPVLGWDGFAALADTAGLPLLALGGQSAATLATAQAHGAHGVAGIRGFR